MGGREISLDKIFKAPVNQHGYDTGACNNESEMGCGFQTVDKLPVNAFVSRALTTSDVFEGVQSKDIAFLDRNGDGNITRAEVMPLVNATQSWVNDNKEVISRPDVEKFFKLK